MKQRTAEYVREYKPTDLIINAVRGMLPKNRLGRQLIVHLKVYVGSEHPHLAQNPKKIDIPMKEGVK